MIPIRKKIWELPNINPTSEKDYLSRRTVLAGTSALIGASLLPSKKAHADLPPLKAQTNPNYASLDRELTAESEAISYNNFYEFGSHKSIAPAAQALATEPWKITIDGLVSSPLELDIDDILGRVSLEERLYRLRCVETWAMAVPWIGFPFKKLLDIAQPLQSAKYIVMETDIQKDVMSGLSQSWYPWPYKEGLSIQEADNDLAFLVVGLYGKKLPPQNGSPIRLAVPWKYGFKSVKSIKKFTFVDSIQPTFWTAVAGNEYGFWANVNPDVPHRRWSQSSEKMIGTGERFDTQIFNGYGDAVASLYQGQLNNPKYFF
jgi:sulfoxide reductase catalytic subunit YedY